MKVVVYDMPPEIDSNGQEIVVCPRCKALESALKKMNVVFETRDMTSPAVLTDLRIAGVFALSAPVLQVGGNFYEDLFDDGVLDIGAVQDVIGNVRKD